MTKTFVVGRHQLSLSLRRKAGRPKKSLKSHISTFRDSLVSVSKDKGFAGNPISRIFRYLFEGKRIKSLLGVNLTIAVIFSSAMGIPSYGFDQQPEITTLQNQTVALVTEKSVRRPLDSFLISQPFRAYHPGIDFRSPIGSPIYPIMEGKVELIAYDRFGYGNHIIIDHGSGFKSLYAHLSKIKVKEDDAVAKDTVIGLVGSTGWSTGPHLHFEVWENGRPFDPLTILK